MPGVGLTQARPAPTTIDPAPVAGQPRAAPSGWALWVPLLVCGGALVTLAVGLAAKAAGFDWGAPAQPLVVFLRPALSTWALPAALVLAASLYGAVRLARAEVAVGPLGFAAATFGLALATRLALNVFRGGPGALDQPFVVGRAGEGRTEFLPGLTELMQQIQSAPDSLVNIYAMNMAQRDVLLRRADSAKVNVTTEELTQLHKDFAQAVVQSWLAIGIDPK